MARTGQTSMYTEGHTYSLFDPEEVHEDMRVDPRQARLVLARKPATMQQHDKCAECEQILAAAAASAGGEESTGYPHLDDAVRAHSTRSAQMVISRANLARMVGLGPGERIERMFVDDDPQLLHLIVAAEHFAPVVDGSPTPVALASPGVLGVRRQAGTRSSSYDALVKLNQGSRDAAREKRS